ncbi:MAG: GNAT family N-acetyltransferase [Pedobacter sp.]|nr:MAG: GNAT family N-acetyltransferase [Pedobacter sp.]
MSFQNLTIRDRENWDDYMEKSFIHETFHSWLYHKLINEGEPLLFVHQRDDLFIALPVIKRTIPDSAYSDMTSAYGYCGPVSNLDLTIISEDVIADFKQGFKDFMREEKSICIFSRLHPFSGQQRILEAFGGVRPNGATVYIDLTISAEQQKKGYDKRLFRQIKNLREAGYEIKESKSEEAIRAFAHIYHENMDRLNASSRYYFDYKYFEGILNMTGYDNRLLLIYNGSELICGAIVLGSRQIIRNHLSATATNYLKHSPSKLLTDEIREIGCRNANKIFHLGGGLAGKVDSLFEFKRRFSVLKVDDYTWCYVNDEINYNNLVMQSGFEIDQVSEYFPLYRQPMLQMTVSCTD